MTLTLQQLQQIMPYAKDRATIFLLDLNNAMEEFEINTPIRQAAFLAQVGHESGQLKYVKELASGSAYEGRADLGNKAPGDGVRYKGRGLIQITGKANYAAVMMALGVDCLSHPEVLEQPVNACRSACWFWDSHSLSQLADVGDFLTITKRINGGINGLEDRTALYEVAKKVLST